ncbi:PAS and helix-turn-helix domain-containing protein [Stieleria varia]|uniref:Putative transcription factor YjjQ n=1 Tax=Stieleria varia TaxID=2528005 RepID=A0A5C5ZVJ2_9BACT|nr:PAS and helix-turn-helix domain-containing protein [Stieleria varia]TWT91574.1 putative transcription factor YjjQ [Stieleria varia]
MTTPIEPTKRESAISRVSPQRIDPPEFDPTSIWMALTNTEGIGVCVMDRQGGLIFVNETTLGLFFDHPIDYHGKTIADFHPPEFVKERLEMIHQVLEQNRPLKIEHILHGRPIVSAVWPIHDVKPPYQRVLVISRTNTKIDYSGLRIPDHIETMDTKYIDLGPLDCLSRRELEVLALIGHGLSVPQVAGLLHRSQKTIENHKSSIAQKLSLHGQAEMVSIVTSMGLEVDDAKRKRMTR